MRPVSLDEETPADGQPLFVEFVNTLHWYEGTPIELIGTEADLAAWLAEHDLPAADFAGRLAQVHLLREQVRAITAALASRHDPPDADLAALQAALSAPTGSLTLVDVVSSRPHLSFA